MVMTKPGLEHERPDFWCILVLLAKIAPLCLLYRVPCLLQLCSSNAGLGVAAHEKLALKKEDQSISLNFTDRS